LKRRREKIDRKIKQEFVHTKLVDVVNEVEENDLSVELDALEIFTDHG
jgi:hypothetical protein